MHGNIPLVADSLVTRILGEDKKVMVRRVIRWIFFVIRIVRENNKIVQGGESDEYKGVGTWRGKYLYRADFE